MLSNVQCFKDTMPQCTMGKWVSGNWHLEIWNWLHVIFWSKNNSFHSRLILSSWASTNIWSADDLGITLLKNSTTNETSLVELSWESQIWVKNYCANISKKNMCHFRNPFSLLTEPERRSLLRAFLPDRIPFFTLWPCKMLSSAEALFYLQWRFFSTLTKVVF